MDECDISVVIIARNEEEMIDLCLQSVFLALKYAVEKDVIKTYEVILADSASTDKTVEIAKKYPIKIVQLRSSWPLSAPAGRYIGSLYAKGTYVFFTDGDTQVEETWIAIAVPYLIDNRVAGVDGYEREYIDESSTFHDLIQQETKKSESNDVEIADFVAKAIFKRKVLDEVGSYNPYLKGSEERELSYRIKDQGYEILRLPHYAITHYWAKKSGKLSYITMLRTMLIWSIGDGQLTRYNPNKKKILKMQRVKYFRWGMMKNYILFLILGTTLLINMVAMFTYPSVFFPVTLTVDVLFFLSLWIGKHRKGLPWKKYIYERFQLAPYTFIRQAGFFIGFLKTPKPASDYPTDAIVIKE